MKLSLLIISSLIGLNSHAKSVDKDSNTTNSKPESANAESQYATVKIKKSLLKQLIEEGRVKEVTSMDSMNCTGSLCDISK